MKKQKNIIPMVASIIIIIAVIIGGGVYIWRSNLEVEPLSYLIANSPISVSKDKIPFNFTVGQLKSAAEECGIKHEEGYFDKLIAKFNGTTKIVYNFKYRGSNQDNSIFVVTLLPNKVGYGSLDQFKTDFNICAAGGNAYPQMLNSNWLLFVNSCGTGFDGGSGRVHGCDEVRKIVEPSLKLN